MEKHVVPPATAEQIMRTVGVTREEAELVDRILKEVEEEDPYEEEGSTLRPPNKGKKS